MSEDVTTYIQIDGQTVEAALVTNKIPDRKFRDAWKLGAGSVVQVDMTKALEIAKNRVRGERAAVLSTLDAKWNVAFGRKDTAAADAIEAQRQVLRDATRDVRLAAATTPEDLDAAVSAIMAEMHA